MIQLKNIEIWNLKTEHFDGITSCQSKKYRQSNISFICVITYKFVKFYHSLTPCHHFGYSLYQSRQLTNDLLILILVPKLCALIFLDYQKYNHQKKSFAPSIATALLYPDYCQSQHHLYALQMFAFLWPTATKRLHVYFTCET